MKEKKPRQRVRKSGFLIHPKREDQFEIILLYLKRHPAGSLVKDIVYATGAHYVTIKKRIAELLYLNKITYRNIIGKIKMYYIK